jgi:HJR/Mrr/RecB family endonuclease
MRNIGLFDESAIDDSAFIGELSLAGDVMPVRGVLAAISCARSLGLRRIFVPAKNAQPNDQSGLEVIPVDSLNEAAGVLFGTIQSVSLRERSPLPSYFMEVEQPTEKRLSPKEEALVKTDNARSALRRLRQILRDGLGKPPVDVWEWIRARDPFTEGEPAAPQPGAGVIESEEQGAESLHAARDAWERRRSAHARLQTERASSLQGRYESRDAAAVTEYCEIVLSHSDLPDCLPLEAQLEYNPSTAILVLDYRLPSLEDLPTLAEVKYVKASNTFAEKHLSKDESERLYDDVLYQLTLRTIWEVFRADYQRAVVMLVFNGIVSGVDKSTGADFTACILSLRVSRDEFEALNLARVEPRACFRKLKGVGSPQLFSMTPVAPIMALSREDRRFVESYGVMEKIEEGSNLAAMDWEDFEHLIREVFEKEFSSGGAEVRVTQASRDGGVDAVVFDPDPIRGGKIVIQAKRYAFTVGVSAVRDLYGTIMNEGANKGILVTTSNYGPDAYEFASGKPITLLDGANLLHLLGKHGLKAHINLTQAQQLAHERSRELRTRGPEA